MRIAHLYEFVLKQQELEYVSNILFPAVMPQHFKSLIGANGQVITNITQSAKTGHI